MQRRVLIGAGLIGGAAIVSAVLWFYGPITSEPEWATEAVAPSGQTKWLKQWPRNHGEIVVSVDALLSDGSHRAWERLTRLYRGADQSTKRKILEHATRLPDLKRSLAYVLASVGDDLTPVDQDPMIEETAEMLKDRWAEPDDLDYGRRLMLMQESEKRQWVLAKAMITFAADLSADSDFGIQKAKLSNKLIDLHSDVSSGFIRASIADGMADLGARDVATVLARGPSVPLDELEVTRRESAAQAEALEKLRRGR